MRLANKVALVTGAASGIGEATAKRFAREGARVVVSDIDAEGIDRVVAGIRSEGGVALGVVQDVRDEQGWEDTIDLILKEHERLDILVNNAGFTLPASVEDTTLEAWRAVQAVNMEGVFLGCRAALKVMKENGGAIVNISSIEGIVGDPMAAAYNASKGGVRLFTKSVALHCAEQGYAIRVNSVHPGFINTPLIDRVLETLDEKQRAEVRAMINLKAPMKMMGEPEDIANGCLYLASDEARYVTGAELVIDGGYTCQ